MSIERILQAARKAGASDVHLIAGLPPAFRVNGEIIPMAADVLTRDDAARLVRELLSEVQWAAFERDWEVCVSTNLQGIGRMRVSAYRHSGSAEAAIRLAHLEIPSSSQLGLPPVVDELTRRSAGLVLITGPTGAGKTTTLNYMVDLINREQRVKVVTIEDPVEYVHGAKKAIVVQQELHTDVTSYARALRHVLRQDPNVIVIGELRDLETIETALQAAETGHLVIGTLHTPWADHTVERIVSVFPAEKQNLILAQLAGSLQGILAQLLLPRADRKGRVLSMEVLLANNAVRNLIREGNPHMLASVMQTSGREGMRPMDVSLHDLYKDGTITWDVAMSHARNPGIFKKS
ncbi:MAG: PilT/PilU family type 4a pilus ATPase [Planctomycetes bacterium]|nr:PilT/PilU family type 4a pilus ATPase [Planctomycetota bacterium]